MQAFWTYLTLGFNHIADLGGYDHMLFIITLCAVYKPGEWRKVLILVTAFTIGHSVTLVMSALNILILPAGLVETLIPLTIFLTAMHNVVSYKATGSTFGRDDRIHYLLALVFGFIHGMGFSNYFRALLGSSDEILMPLFAFNVGLELGQILIVAVFFLVYTLLDRLFSLNTNSWKIFISGAGAGVSLIMVLERLAG